MLGKVECDGATGWFLFSLGSVVYLLYSQNMGYISIQEMKIED